MSAALLSSSHFRELPYCASVELMSVSRCTGDCSTLITAVKLMAARPSGLGRPLPVTKGRFREAREGALEAVVRDRTLEKGKGRTTLLKRLKLSAAAINTTT